MQHDFIMRSKMSVMKSKMGTIKSKIGRKFEQKRKAKWVKEKANLVKAYESYACTYAYGVHEARCGHILFLVISYKYFQS